jgi:hypothetical protein
LRRMTDSIKSPESITAHQVRHGTYGTARESLFFDQRTSQTLPVVLACASLWYKH